MLTSHFNRYIAACVTHNRAIDKAVIGAELGLNVEVEKEETEIENFVFGAICEFVLSAHEVTGSPGVRNEPRAFRLRRKKRGKK